MSVVALWHGLTYGLSKPERKIGELSQNDPPIAAESVLKDAELFLRYAASTEVSVEPKVRDAIIIARTELANGRLENERLGDLYAAYSSLAITAKPVTVETIRACRDLALGALKRYRSNVFFLTLVVIVLCMAGIPIFRRGRALDRHLDTGVVEDDERHVAATASRAKHGVTEFSEVAHAAHAVVMRCCGRGLLLGLLGNHRLGRD
jgi:hypothetical protein